MEKKKILVVDDEESVRNVLRDILKAFGYEAVIVPGGCEALEALASVDDFGLVITDLMMPKMDGFKFLGYVREYFSDMPVVVYSGYASDSSATKLLKMGAVAVLGKPIDFKKFRNLIEGIFGTQAM